MGKTDITKFTKVALVLPLLGCLLLPLLPALPEEITLRSILETRANDSVYTWRYLYALGLQAGALSLLSSVLFFYARIKEQDRKLAVTPLVFLILVPFSSCAAEGVYRVKAGMHLNPKRSVSVEKLSHDLVPAYVAVSGMPLTEQAVFRTVTHKSKNSTTTSKVYRVPVVGEGFPEGATLPLLLEAKVTSSARGTWEGVLYPGTEAHIESFKEFPMPKAPFVFDPEQTLFLSNESPSGWKWEGALQILFGLGLPLLILIILLKTEL